MPPEDKVIDITWLTLTKILILSEIRNFEITPLRKFFVHKQILLSVNFELATGLLTNFYYDLEQQRIVEGDEVAIEFIKQAIKNADSTRQTD